MKKALVLLTSACALTGSLSFAVPAAAAAGAGTANAASPGAVSGPAGGVISTVAGGVGGPGRATSVAVSPCGVDWAGGWLYIGDGSTVRRVSVATDALTTVAGDNAAGPLDSSGTGAASALGAACGTTADRAGNLVIADGLQVLVAAARTGMFYGQQMTAGHLYTVAGSAAPRDGNPDGDGGPATSAALSDAVNVAFDSAGNLLVADAGSLPADSGNPSLGSLLRVVAARTGRFYGQPMTAGDIYTVAGLQDPGPAGDGGRATRAWLGTAIGSVRPDRAGNLVLADAGENYRFEPVLAPSVRVIAALTGTFYGQKMTAGHIYRVAGNGRAGSTGDGGLATRASLEAAGSAVLDGAGNLVIADNSKVRVAAARSGRFYGQPMTAGHIYAIAGTGWAGYSGDGGPAGRAEVAAGTAALDAAGNVLLAGVHRVRVVAARTGTFYGRKMTARDIYTVAGNGTAFSGDGGLPLRAEFSSPGGVSADGAGDIAFSAVTVPGAGASTTVDLIAARPGTFFGRRLTAGRLYTIAGNGSTGFRGDGGPARSAEFCMGADSAAVAFDGSGNLAVADWCNNRVRLVAVRSGRFFGQNMTAGRVYTIAGTGAGGFSGDGGPAVRARLSFPAAAGVDHHGNVLIADEGNDRVRVIAAATGTFYGQKMTAGHIYTVAGNGSRHFSGDGGPAVKAGMNPLAAAPDPAGNLIITDGSERVRLVAATTGTFYGRMMTAGRVYTIAGDGQFGSSGSGGPAAKAQFEFPGGVSADRHGNVVFTDTVFTDGVRGLVWVLAVRTGTFYGQPMTAGDIYAVAGGGATLGDGGPAASALLRNTVAAAVSPAGSLLVTDGNDNRLRAISP
jgi:hypothetical protein